MGVPFPIFGGTLSGDMGAKKRWGYVSIFLGVTLIRTHKIICHFQPFKVDKSYFLNLKTTNKLIFRNRQLTSNYINQRLMTSMVGINWFHHENWKYSTLSRLLIYSNWFFNRYLKNCYHKFLPNSLPNLYWLFFFKLNFYLLYYVKI